MHLFNTFSHVHVKAFLGLGYKKTITTAATDKKTKKHEVNKSWKGG